MTSKEWKEKAMQLRAESLEREARFEPGEAGAVRLARQAEACERLARTTEKMTPENDPELERLQRAAEEATFAVSEYLRERYRKLPIAERMRIHDAFRWSIRYAGRRRD